MMTEEIIGKPLAELKEWSKDEVLDLLGITGSPAMHESALPLKAKKVVWGSRRRG